MLYFKFPFDNNICTLEGISTTPTVTFVPFDESKNLEFFGQIKSINNLPKTDFDELILLKDFVEENQQEYIDKISHIIEFIKDNKLKKLVIARQKAFDFNGKKVDLSHSFQNICNAHPNAFAYMAFANGVARIGAFSELLGKFNKKTSEFETVSLAGTLPLNEDWTEKEIDEQKTVTDYISAILKNYTSHLEVSAPKDHISGNIKHLKTEFSARINADDFNEIINELHPTPAVCGIPKAFCKTSIQKFEKYPRGYYSGYIRIETGDTIQCFVNLRCAEFYQNKAIAFVGGGITPKSDPAKEWRETELKSEAVLKNITVF